jgi:uncharacterized protein YndB with AHSA1/START domain
MRVFRTVLLSGGVVSLLLSSLAHGEERLVIPYSCKVHRGHVDLIPSRRQAYRVYGARERQILTTCSPAVPDRCRSWTLHRFDLDCGGTRVPWPRVVAAVSERKTPGLAWLAHGRLHVSMGPWWAGAFASPCRGARWWYGPWSPYEPTYEPTYEPPHGPTYDPPFKPPYGAPYGPLDGQAFEPPYGQPYVPPPADWRCMDQPSPQSAVDFPPGFAPLMGTKAQFIAATTPGWTELTKNPPFAAAVPEAPPGIAKRRDHAAPATDRGAQSEQRAVPPAAKIKDQEAAVTPGQTTEPGVPPTDKSELGSPQTSTSTLPKANTPNAGAGAPTSRTLATQRPSSVEDRQLMKALSAWATITDVIRTHLWHIQFLRTRAGRALIGLGAILLAAAALLLAAVRRQQSGLVEEFVPRDSASIDLGDNGLRDPGTSRQSARLPLESAQYIAAGPPSTAQFMAGSAAKFSTRQERSTPSMPQEFVVRKQVIVNASQAEAFAIFTEDVGQWWPLATHHVGERTPATAILEPFVNGRWFERAIDATEHDWGTVLAIEPSYRLVIAWLTTHINPRALEPTEVEILFVPQGSDMIRVELEHRHLERYGDSSTNMYSILDGDDGWGLILRRFAAACTVASYE